MGEKSKSGKIFRISFLLAIITHFFFFYIVFPDFGKALIVEKKVNIIKVHKLPKKEMEKPKVKKKIKKKLKLRPIPDPTPDEIEPIVEAEPEPEIMIDIPDDAEIVWGEPDAPDSDLFLDSGPVEVINTTQKPQEIKNPQNYLEYPKLAATSGFKGMVITRVLLNEQGSPVTVQILKSPKNKFASEFEKAAIEAIMKGKWTPGYQGDRAVKCWMQYIVRFNP